MKSGILGHIFAGRKPRSKLEQVSEEMQELVGTLCHELVKTSFDSRDENEINHLMKKLKN